MFQLYSRFPVSSEIYSLKKISVTAVTVAANVFTEISFFFFSFIFNGNHRFEVMQICFFLFEAFQLNSLLLCLQTM